MLIRSSPVVLERKRAPVGPLRVNYDNPLTEALVGLWVWNAQNAGVDLTRRNPTLTWQGAAELRGGPEGIGLNCAASGTSGARLLFSTGSPLIVTTGAGQAIWVRLHVTDVAPTSSSMLMGVNYAGNNNPFCINSIGTGGSALSVVMWRNSAGTFEDEFASIPAAFVPVGLGQSLNYGVAARGYVAGSQAFSNSSNAAAPNYSGTNDIFGFGYDGINSRNSQSHIYTGGVWSRPLAEQDYAFLESEPYSLVEPVRSWVPVYFAAGAPPPPPPPPPAPQIAVTGNGNAITDGQTATSLTDHTDFGSITEGGAPTARTYVFSNPGTATLNISGTSVPSGFTVLTALPSTIATGGVTQPLVIEMPNTPAGTYSGTVSVTHDAPGSPFQFDITATVDSPPPPPPPPPGSVRTSRTDSLRGTVFGLIRQ